MAANAASMIPPLVTRSEFAKVVRKSPRTFDRARSRGEIPAADVVIGRAPLWAAATVERFVSGEKSKV